MEGDNADIYLDFSKAFDTVSHCLLVKIKKAKYSIK